MRTILHICSMFMFVRDCMSWFISIQAHSPHKQPQLRLRLYVYISVCVCVCALIQTIIR